MGSEELQQVFSPEPLDKTPAEQREDVLTHVHDHLNRDVRVVLAEEQPDAA